MVTRKSAEPETEDTTETPADVGGQIEATVRKVIGELFGSGKLEVDDEDETEKPTKRPRTAAAQEDDAEAKVRATIAKIEKERAHEQEHEKMKERPTETAPSTVRRITKLMWGE